MQTLNVGAGQSDQEYKAAEQQRRADLIADSRSDANFFFWAAGLAALGTGLLPVRLNILVLLASLTSSPFMAGLSVNSIPWERSVRRLSGWLLWSDWDLPLAAAIVGPSWLA